jgi:hypothetical protein
MAKAKSASTAKQWTKDEVKHLKKMYRNASTAYVAKELGRSVSSVKAKASSLNLTKTKKYLKSIGRG